MRRGRLKVLQKTMAPYSWTRVVDFKHWVNPMHSSPCPRLDGGHTSGEACGYKLIIIMQ